jgi:ribbon-helix-helix CopG family protein
MKRLQIMIDEDLDAALQLMCLDTGRSKASLIREFVRERVTPLPPLEEDPIWSIAGDSDFEPASVDDVVYR